MINALVDQAEIKGVTWHPPTRECVVQFGHYRGHLVGREQLGKAWLLYAPTDELLDELLDQAEGAIVVLAAGALEALGASPAAVPTISGGWVAEKVKGGEAAAKSATGSKAEAVAVADMAKARKDKAAAIAAEVDKAPAEAEPAEKGGELEPLEGGR